MNIIIIYGFCTLLLLFLFHGHPWIHHDKTAPPSVGPGPLPGLRLCQERRRGGAAPGQRRQGQRGGRRRKRGEKVGQRWKNRWKTSGKLWENYENYRKIWEN